MCGIIGYLGARDATPVLIDGLQRLEYRGYDSAGIATFHNGHIAVRRCVGKLENLEKLLRERYGYMGELRAFGERVVDQRIPEDADVAVDAEERDDGRDELCRRPLKHTSP